MKMAWLVCTLAAAFFWGLYGVCAHAGGVRLGSGVRVFLWVGVAYFLIAVLAPGALMAVKTEPGKFTLSGSLWSAGAGAVGALGALGVIFAMRTGGSPLYVMPLVFGLAPLVNVAASMIEHKPEHWPSPLFWVGMVLAATGAGMVLYYKP